MRTAHAGGVGRSESFVLRTKRKIETYGRFLLLLLLSATALNVPAGLHAKEVVSVVVLGDFTAPGAVVDREIWDGMLLGFKGLEAYDEQFSIKLLRRDIEESAQTARTLAAEAIAREGVDFVIALSSLAVEGAMGPAFDAGKTLLAVSDSPPALADRECSRSFFSLSPSSSGTHMLAADYLNRIHRRRTFLVASDTPANQAGLTAFRREYEGLVTSEVLIPPHRMSHSLDISQIRAAASDSVYLSLSGGLAVTFTRQYADSGLKKNVPLFGSWSTFEPPFLMAIGDRALGARSVGFWSNDLRNPVNLAFVEQFEEAYNRFPSTFAALGYDATVVIGALSTRLGRQIHNADAVRTALRRYPIPITRGDLRFATNHFPLTTFYMRRVNKDERGRYLNQVQRIMAEEWQSPTVGACPMKWTPARPG